MTLRDLVKVLPGWITIHVITPTEGQKASAGELVVSKAWYVDKPVSKATPFGYAMEVTIEQEG